MNHPKYEDLLAYLENETLPETAKVIRRHLDECAACNAEIQGWERTIKRLEGLPTPVSQRAQRLRGLGRFFARPALKWGIAAAIVAMAGFAIGRVSMRSGEQENRVAAEVSDKMRQEFRADLIAALDPNPAAQSAFQKELRGEIETTLATQLSNLTGPKSPLFQQLLQIMQQGRDEDRRNLLALLKEIQQENAARFVALRKDLETAAAVADNDLAANRQQMKQLLAAILVKSNSN